MITQRRILKEKKYFHLSTGLLPEIWSTIPTHQRWEILCEGLRQLQKKEYLQAHSFVLMSTHIHLLFSTDAPIEHILMEEFHQQVQKIVSQKLASHWNCEIHNRIEDVFERPLYCDLIQHKSQYKAVYKYIYRNPIEAGLCLKAETYPYSSLHEIIYGKINSDIFLDQMNLLQNPFQTLTWMNCSDDFSFKLLF